MVLPELKRVVLEVFGGCNYSCQMCPQAGGRGSNWTRKMPLPLFKKIIEQIDGSPVVQLEGSGEAFMAKDLEKYIKICSDRGFKSYIYTNGSFVLGDNMKKAIDAGLSFIRFSCIGYNSSLYEKWMSKDNFDLIKFNVRKTIDYVNDSGSSCHVSSYHLILDNSNVAFEIDQYRKNFIDELGTTAYIWKMHNWSGNYIPNYTRDTSKRRTCGRPSAPEITIRAGGLSGHQGAVTPCCQTMGPPNEDMSVLGHLDSNSLNEIYFGEKYQGLISAHKEGRFDDLPFCKNCDFLYDDPEVLVWTNDHTAQTNHMLGTSFSLTEFQ